MLLLFSGLLGAIIATLLSVLYHHISEQKKVRSDVLMEIVSYFDEIYRHLIDMHSYKDHEYMDKKSALHPDEYRMISRELTKLLISAKPATKLVIAYGEGNLMGTFNELKAIFHEVSSALRNSKRDNWESESERINILFSERIEPLRTTLQRSLLNELSTTMIVKETFKRFI
ncbi:MAG: hypothetical protein M0P73_07440 [Syntrophobacterales bacterium]|nr:hypothetical protein [Syntrophobacterales bacterium]